MGATSDKTRVTVRDIFTAASQQKGRSPGSSGRPWGGYHIFKYINICFIYICIYIYIYIIQTILPKPYLPPLHEGECHGWVVFSGRQV